MILPYFQTVLAKLCTSHMRHGLLEVRSTSWLASGLVKALGHIRLKQLGRVCCGES